MTTDRHIPIRRLDPAVERLLNRERIKEARMLPTGKLKDEHHQQVRDLLDKLTIDQESGDRYITFNEVARSIGKSQSVISQWYSGNYPARMDPITRAVNRFVETTIQRQQTLGEKQFVMTWVAEMMIARVSMAHNAKKMLCMVAPAGSGKTMVIEYLADEYSGFTIYIDGQLRPKAFLQRLARAVRVPESGTANELMERIVARLKGRQTIIFIDEAHLLNHQCAGVIRAIYDQTGVTIAMFGARQMFEMIDDRASGGGQFWRRCHKVNMLKQASLTPNDRGEPGRMLFSAAEIREVVAARGMRLADDDAVQMMTTIANVPDSGALDLVTSLMSNIAYLYGEDQPISVSALVNALMSSDDVNGEHLIGQVNLDQGEQYSEAVA